MVLEGIKELMPRLGRDTVYEKREDLQFLKDRHYSDYKALTLEDLDLNIVQMNSVYNDITND